MREDESCKIFNKGKKAFSFSVQRVKGQWRKTVKNAGEKRRRMNDDNTVKSHVNNIHTPPHAALEREDGLSRHQTVNGPAAVWRNVVNSISKRVRAGYQRRKGPIIEVNLAALACSEGAAVWTVSQGKQTENDEQQMQPSLKTREGRQNNRLLRREKEREARARAREKRIVTHVMQTVMSPSRGGIQSRTVVTPNQLQSCRFVEANRATIGNEENNQKKIGAENPNEQSQWYTVTDDIKEEVPSGKEKDQEKEDKEKKKAIRTVEDGLLMVVSARINGRKTRTLIDSGATRCFVSPPCVTACGLKGVPRDVFLELGNGEKILSRGYIPDVPVVTAGLTVKTGLTVTNLLHDVDLVLGMNWLKLVNPIVDWCGARLYVPNAVHTALLQGNWLDHYVKVGTVTVLSSEEELEDLKDERVRSSISVLKAPKFWKWQNEKINSRANLSEGGEWDFVNADDCKLLTDCKNSCNEERRLCKLFVMKTDQGIVKVKRLCNNARLPVRGTTGAAGYDLAAAQNAVVPAHGKVLVKTGLSISMPTGCYGRIAPRSGLALKKFIDVGAGVVDEDYRGELGVILFNFGDEDFKINMGDKIAQLIFEKIKTAEVVEVDSLEETGRGEKGFGSTGIKSEEQKIIGQSPDQISSADQSADSAQDKKYVKEFKNEPIPHTNVRSQASKTRQIITARQIQKLAKQGQPV